MKKSVGRRLVTLLFIISCFLSIQVFSINKPDPYSKLPQLVELSTGSILPSDPKYPTGESLDNNDLVKWIETNLNIRIKYAWTTSDQNNTYETKLNMLIAGNDLPDVFSINVEPYGFNILRKLINNNMIMEVTKVFNDYASPTLKEYHGKSGNAALKEVTFNGRLMAIPSLSDVESALPIIWVRQDWLNQLKLSGPVTLDDLEKIVRVFKQKKNSPSLPACNMLFRSDTASFDFLFNAYNSYPADWIRDKKGKVVYGSVQPETKAALAKLQEWYKKGIIDPEFALKDPDKAVEPVRANKAGVFQGAWWSAWWPIQDSKKNDPKVVWKPYYIKGMDGKYHGRSYPVVRSFIVIKKNYRHPEAVMKIINWNEDAMLKKLTWYNKLIGPGGKYNTTSAALWPIGAGAKYLDEISRRYMLIMDVVEGRTPLEKADPETKFQAETILKDRQNPGQDLGAWCIANQWEGASIFAKYKIEQKYPAFAGSTTLMVQKKAILQDLETKTFLNIIMGKAPISEFDNFVKQWHTLGGKAITEEINQLVKK